MTREADASDDIIWPNAARGRASALSRLALRLSLGLTLALANGPGGLAHDATPGAGGAPAHVAHIHNGTCDHLDPNPLYPLHDLQASPPAAAATSAIPVERSVTTLDVTLADLMQGEHAVNVHAGGERIMDYLACGQIAGPMTGDGLAVGLREQNDSGYEGIAWFHVNPDGTTTVTIFLAQGLSGPAVGPAAAETPAASTAAATGAGTPLPAAATPCATPAASPVAGTPSTASTSPESLPKAGTPVTAGDLTVTLLAAKKDAGPNTLAVQVRDACDAAVTDATVTLQIKSLDMDMGTTKATAVPSEPGRYVARDVPMGMGGKWQVEITIARPGRATVAVSCLVTLQGPM